MKIPTLPPLYITPVYTMFPVATAAKFQATVVETGLRESTNGNGIGNVSRSDCRGRRGKFFKNQKICHGNHGAYELLYSTQSNGVNATKRDSTLQTVPNLGQYP